MKNLSYANRYSYWIKECLDNEFENIQNPFWEMLFQQLSCEIAQFIQSESLEFLQYFPVTQNTQLLKQNL